MATLTLNNVDISLLTKQVQTLLDLAYRERTKAEKKEQRDRLATSADLEAVLDMLSDGTIS